MRQKLIRSLFVAMALVLGVSTMGYAQRNRPPRYKVPEINPTYATAALAMLAGGIFVIRARRR